MNESEILEGWLEMCMNKSYIISPDGDGCFTYPIWRAANRCCKGGAAKEERGSYRFAEQLQGLLGWESGVEETGAGPAGFQRIVPCSRGYRIHRCF